MQLTVTFSKTGTTCRVFVVIILAITAIACSREAVHQYQSFAFGTIVEIKIRHPDKAVADQASQLIFARFDELHDKWHAWEPGELMQANHAFAQGTGFTVDGDLLTLLQLSKDYSLRSNNLFNPAIGKLIALWGFQSSVMPTTPPRESAIEEMLKDLPTMRNLEISGNRISSSNPNLQLDLGAIAKGYAVQLGMDELRKQGIRDALLNAGGDLCGIGSGSKRPWQIGIRDPGGKGIVGSIALSNGECVFTSGNYERFFFYKNRRYHHIIDPRTGYPARHVVSVTVLHNNAALADAASTALFIAGPGQLAEIAAGLGVSDVMMIDDQNRIFITPSMKSRVILEDNGRNREIITIQSDGSPADEN